MSAADIHLALNHFPVVGVLIAAALMLASLVRKSPGLLKASLVSFVIVAAIAIPVYLTGEPAEEIVEHLAGVAHDTIEQHEDAALFAFIAMESLGALAILGLIFYRRNRVPRWYALAVGALGVGATAWTLWTAALGGRISHPELQPGFSPPAEEESQH